MECFVLSCVITSFRKAFLLNYSRCMPLIWSIYLLHLEKKVFLIKRKVPATYTSVGCPQFREGLHENVTLVRTGSSLPKPLPAPSCFALFLKKKKKPPRLAFILYWFSYSSFMFLYFFTIAQKKSVSSCLKWSPYYISWHSRFPKHLNRIFNTCAEGYSTQHLFKLAFQTSHQFSPTTVFPNRHLAILFCLFCLPSLCMQGLPVHSDWKPDSHPSSWNLSTGLKEDLSEYSR